MAASFEIGKARVGHIEPINSGKSLKMVVYTSRKTGTAEGGTPQFKNDAYELVAFGQRAQDWASMEVGQKLNKITGEMRGAQLVAWAIEVAEISGDEAETTEAAQATEASEEAAHEAAPEAEEAPKAKKSGRRKTKTVEDDLI